MKKLSLALVPAAFLTTAVHADMGTGFYAGVHTAWDSTQTESKGLDSGSLVLSGNILVSFSNSEKAKMGPNNINFGILFGYGQVYDSWYFGGEIGYTISNIKMRKNVESAININNGLSQINTCIYLN